MSVFCSLAIKYNLYPRSTFCYCTLSKIFIYAQYFAVVRSAKSLSTLSILLLGGQHNLFARSIFCYCTVSIIFLHERENQQKEIIIRKAPSLPDHENFLKTTNKSALTIRFTRTRQQKSSIFPFFSFIKKSFIFIEENQLSFKEEFFCSILIRHLFLNIAILRGTK